MFRLVANVDLSGVLSSEQIAQIQTAPTVIKTLDESQAKAVREAYSDAFSQTMLICLYMAAVAFVASLFTFQRKPAKTT